MKNKYRRYSWRIPTEMDMFYRGVARARELAREMNVQSTDEYKPIITSFNLKIHDNDLPY